MLGQGCTRGDSPCSTGAMMASQPPPESALGGTHSPKSSVECISGHAFARCAGTRVKSSSWIAWGTGILLLSCGTISIADAFSVTAPLHQGGRSMVFPGGDTRGGGGGATARSYKQVGMHQQQRQSSWTGAGMGGVVGSATSSLERR